VSEIRVFSFKSNERERTVTSENQLYSCWFSMKNCSFDHMCAGLFSLFFVASGLSFPFFPHGRFLFGSWGLIFRCSLSSHRISAAESWSPRTGFHQRIYIPNLFSCSASIPTRAGFFCLSIYSLSHLESAPASFSLGLGSVLSQLCLLCHFDSSSLSPVSPGQVRLKLSSHFLTAQCLARSEFLRPASFTCGA
jgi:hypothetical protein